MEGSHRGEGPDPSEIPPIIEDVVRQLGIYVPEHCSREERELYSRGLNQKCMLCERPLGIHTIVVVNALGVIMLFCGGPCLQDMQVQGYLQEAYDDLVADIKMRHNVPADSPQEEENDAGE